MLWLLLAACVQDLPPSDIVIDERPWTVQGASVKAIRESIYEQSPRWGAAGRTRVQAEVSCQPGLADEGVGDVSVEVRIEVALPEWDRPDDAPSWLTRRWNRFEQAVREHEWEHAEIASAHLADLDQRMRDARDCEAAFEEARDAVAELDDLQDAWDAQYRGIRF
jgi:predicted secreted Zn-dependent protease